MSDNQDGKITKLLELVQQKRQEIERINNPVFKTNCGFSYRESGNEIINLHTVTDVGELVKIGAFVEDMAARYLAFSNFHKVNAPKFTWRTFSVSDWTDDIKMRIAKVQISAKKKELDDLENRLNKLVSPELRQKMELELIEKQLGLNG